MGTRQLSGTLAVFALAIGLAQTALTNDAVIKMAKAGLGEEVILSSVNAQPGKYATSTDDLIALKGAGVGDKVIAAMVAKEAAGSAPKAELPVVAKDGILLPDELGIYFLKDKKYIPVRPEILNLRTARAAAAFTYGIKAAKVNGWVQGRHSPTHVGPSAEFVLKLPEGTDPAEYICVRFNVKRDRREVELARGRINISISTVRAAVPFQSEKLAKQIYQLKFGTFSAGEYGLLPPGANVSSNAASAGKIYAFLVE
ncbi:MAG TPA: hypothetical protein VNY05_00310 [Candidatus Acidoferrales bacterium]|nr:hypothetical protein [Candidatus Acidoferrales bacterium]